MMSVPKAVTVLGVGLLGQEVRDMGDIRKLSYGCEVHKFGGTRDSSQSIFSLLLRVS